MLPEECSLGRSAHLRGVTLVAPGCKIYRYGGCVESGGCDAVVVCGRLAIAIKIKKGALSPSDLSNAVRQLERCRDRLRRGVCMVVAYERPSIAALLRSHRGVVLVRMHERRLEVSRLVELCTGARRRRRR